MNPDVSWSAKKSLSEYNSSIELELEFLNDNVFNRCIKYAKHHGLYPESKLEQLVPFIFEISDNLKRSCELFFDAFKQISLNLETINTKLENLDKFSQTAGGNLLKPKFVDGVSDEDLELRAGGEQIRESNKILDDINTSINNLRNELEQKLNMNNNNFNQLFNNCLNKICKENEQNKKEIQNELDKLKNFMKKCQDQSKICVHKPEYDEKPNFDKIFESENKYTEHKGIISKLPY